MSGASAGPAGERQPGLAERAPWGRPIDMPSLHGLLPLQGWAMGGTTAVGARILRDVQAALERQRRRAPASRSSRSIPVAAILFQARPRSCRSDAGLGSGDRRGKRRVQPNTLLLPQAEPDAPQRLPRRPAGPCSPRRRRQRPGHLQQPIDADRGSPAPATAALRLGPAASRQRVGSARGKNTVNELPPRSVSRPPRR
jgi:hypothetical protein